MNQKPNQKPSGEQLINQQQSLGDVQVQGDDNVFNVIQGQIVTLTQTKIIQISVDEIKTRELITASPYKGLKKFEPEDSDRFFGRDQFIGGLVNDLEQTNFILLLGASGSGKSSVIRAGLIPWLQQKWGKRFVSLVLTPDLDPFESLYGSLLSRGYSQAQAQMAKAGNANTLSQVVKTLKRPEAFWLISIDQFEELFTVSKDERRNCFIDSLIKLSQASSPGVKIVATMRADFLDRLSPYPRLVKVTDRHRPLMSEMQVDELRLAIEQPASHHGVVFETGLVEEIINAVQGQAGYLPLLQYTLDLLWESEVQNDGLQDRTLNTMSYRRLGGVRGALQQRVDEIYTALSKAEQLAAQRIFLKLVEIDGDSELGTEQKSVRRRAARSEFADEQEQRVLAQLIDQNLLVSDAIASADGSASISTVEIAHEILLTSWGRLHEWIKDNHQSISLRNRLNEDVTHWQAKKIDDELWSGSKLEQVLELSKDPTFNQVLGGFNPTATEFIKASEVKRDRQRRRTIVGLSVFSTLTLALATFSSIQYQRAEIDQVKALQGAADARFATNRYELDSLLLSLDAAKRFQSLIWINSDSQQQAEMRTTLGQSLYWTREQNRLAGHQDIVQSVQFSPDGQMLATASYDKTVKLWRADGTLITTLEGHTQPVMSVSFSPDGQMVATASQDGTVRLWTHTGRFLREIKAHVQGVFSVQFSPNGQTIVTSSEDRTAKLWRLDGQLLGTLKGHLGWVRRAIFSPDAQQLVTISGKTAKLWRRDGTLLKFLTGHQDDIQGVDFSKDSRVLTTASLDRTVKLWSRGGQLLQTFKHPEAVWSVNFSPDGQTMVTGNSKGEIRLWTLDGRLIDQWVAHKGEIPSLAFSPDGQMLVTGSNDGMAKLWRINRSGLTTLSGHGSVISAQFSPDEQRIASVGEEGLLNLWGKSGQLLFTQNGQQESLYDIVFSPNGQMLATAGDDATVKLWNRNGKALKTLRGHQDSVNAVRFSPDGKMLVTSSDDSTAKLWNLDGVEIKTLKGHRGRVLSTSFSPDGRLIATSSDDQSVKLWNLNGTERKTLKGHTGRVWSVVFSPDGQTIATASADKTAKLWNVDGAPLVTLVGHTAAVLYASFSADGQTIASASSDRTIKLWQRDGTLITTLMGHQADVNTVKFSPGGQWLISAGGDGKILLWNVSTLNLQGLIEQGCHQVQDYLKAHSDESRGLCK
jgi:WD40 repeat protein